MSQLLLGGTGITGLLHESVLCLSPGSGGAASAGEMAVEGGGGDTEPTSDLFDGDHWVAEERLGGLQVVRGKCRRPATTTWTDQPSFVFSSHCSACSRFEYLKRVVQI